MKQETYGVLAMGLMCLGMFGMCTVMCISDEKQINNSRKRCAEVGALMTQWSDTCEFGEDEEGTKRCRAAGGIPTRMEALGRLLCRLPKL